MGNNENMVINDNLAANDNVVEKDSMVTSDQTGKSDAAMPAVNRTFKSTVFIMLFEDKKNLLELYNAISGKHYTDPELLEINTLENAIYMSIKNDVSFLIDGRLSLYEHQSTYNPNLPLRFLLYIANQYASITKDVNLYGTRLVEIPTPEFIIFYNGRKDCPDRQVLRLSDMYTVKDKSYKLELEATMLNINGTHNQNLKEACQTLKEYAIYTDKIRKYTEKISLEDAAERAICECIDEGVLKEFLEKHRAEAKAMSIFEYDQEKHIRMEREEAWEEGRREGEADGLRRGREDGIREGRESGFREGEEKALLLAKRIFKLSQAGKSLEEIAEICGISEEKVKQILE